MFGVRVARIDRDGDGWRLRTSVADLTGSQVVVASGFEHTPVIPDWPGRADFAKPLLHAAAYRNPRPFAGRDVLVVGPGSSGMEIAEDLAGGGARRVWLSVRRLPNIMLRTPLGALIGRLLLRVSPARADRVARFARRKSIGDLSRFGLPDPEDGVFTRVVRDKVAPSIVDRSTIQAIKERRIEVVASVESMDATAVRLSDGSSIEPDAVIASTGYRPGLEAMVGHLGVLDDRGIPRATGAVPAAPGLRFVGFVPLPAQLGYLGKEAKWAARAIVRERAHPGAPARGRLRSLESLLQRA
jgi:cation diffusion facilitator CzcD-associated flavoprotein CzcO